MALVMARKGSTMSDETEDTEETPLTLEQKVDIILQGLSGIAGALAIHDLPVDGAKDEAKVMLLTVTLQVAAALHGREQTRQEVRELIAKNVSERKIDDKAN